LQYRNSNSKCFKAAVDAIVDDFTAVPYTGGIGGTTIIRIIMIPLMSYFKSADVNLLSGTAYRICT
jgi:hypothetical protein